MVHVLHVRWEQGKPGHIHCIPNDVRAKEEADAHELQCGQLEHLQGGEFHLHQLRLLQHLREQYLP